MTDLTDSSRSPPAPVSAATPSTPRKALGSTCVLLLTNPWPCACCSRWNAKPTSCACATPYHNRPRSQERNTLRNETLY